MNKLSFGECPICRQGALIAVKDVATDRLLIMCDDCESQWLTPSDAESFDKAISDEVSNVVLATLNEIEAIGWSGSES